VILPLAAVAAGFWVSEVEAVVGAADGAADAAVVGALAALPQAARLRASTV